MKFVSGFTVFLLFGFALGNEIFSEETIAAFNFDMGNEVVDEKIVSAFNVMDYGAVGNGQVDDSQWYYPLGHGSNSYVYRIHGTAFEKAWKGACNTNVGEGIATIVVPQGKTFLLNPLVFQGPCLAKALHFQVGGTLIAPQSTSWGNGGMGEWIYFQSVDNLMLDGHGTFDGRAPFGGHFGMFFDCQRRPGALHFHNCNGLKVKGLTHVDSPRSHISVNGCKNVVLSDLHIKAPQDSPNTDGIDISSSSNVQILDSTIQTGDDCVAINGGSSFIYINRVNCGPGHGISIGSLGDGAYDTVEEVHVTNCNLTNTQNGVRIKTFQGGSGFARKISFEHILLNNVDNPIIINQFYQDKGRLRSYGIWKKAAAIQVSDVTYSDIRGTSANDQAIDLDCDNVVGCSNIQMRNINIETSVNPPKIYGSCNNAHGTAFDVHPKVPCLS
ncbi:probable polygalacturonase At3g15720 [Hibiscus syriacus]|uniref:probable polygalacturonase At3g15720 n=1 Tax=Hibiscus syriacus TaxID=106335 RepID=UPI0019204740|nr:probable polygalacturonase At3g15720 [Hibiscus syriacus]